MPSSAVIATHLTSPGTVPFRLFVGGEDIMKRSDGSGVSLDSLSIEYAGSGRSRDAPVQPRRPGQGRHPRGHAELRLWNQASDSDEFAGFLMGRTSRPDFGQVGRATGMIATDHSILLDRNMVTKAIYPSGLSDRTIIQGLLGNFCIGWLRSSATKIASTNASMPAMAFQMLTLRAALDQVASVAAGDGQGDRTLYVDSIRAVNYFLTSAAAAPYVVTDNPVGGAQVAPQNLELVDDDSGIYTAVYIIGANGAGSGWELAPNAAISRYGWRATSLDVPDSNSAAKRSLYGQSYLVSHSIPIRRGTFYVVGTTGWAPGQVVTITNAALGLSSATFLIKHVTGVPVGGSPVWRHDIEFGARQPRLSRATDFRSVRRR
jgi:hypothetical protein